jgi:solute carrier family 13 (sodium-dependent dicarboxylate transporter), member 2/3/5
MKSLLAVLNSKYGLKNIALLTAALAGGLTFLILHQTGGMPREAVFMAAIFALAALLWMTEALPLFATSLLVIGLQLVLLSNPGDWPGFGFETEPSPSFREILHIAADPVLLLFFGGFLLARAAVKENVDKAISSLLLLPFGSRPGILLLGLMLVTATFSMWMSNTATTAMMVALIAPILARMEKGDRFRKGIVLAIPFGANIGGIGTPIASPPNAIALGFIQKSGFKIGFLDWMLVAVPLMLVLLAAAWSILYFLYRPQAPGMRLAAERFPVSKRGWFVVAVFTVTVLLWLSDRWHGLPAAVVALLPAIAFTATGILNRDDLNRIEWNILILIAGGISLGAGMQMTGLDQHLVRLLPENIGGAALLAVLLGATFFLGTFMSNTAAANLLLPIGVSSAALLSPEAGIGPVQISLSIALAASMTMALPISTPPNAIAYSTGEFNTFHLAAAGLPLGVTALVLIIFYGGPALRFWNIGG